MIKSNIYALIFIFAVLFLFAPALSMRIPEIPENFIADYSMAEPFPNSGKYYRSFTNQIERFDTEFFGMTSTNINYYRCGFEIQYPGCEKKDLTNEMYPLQLPPWADYKGNVTISGHNSEHWHFNLTFFDIDFDIYITTNNQGELVPIRQRFEMNEMFKFVVDIEFSNVILGEIEDSKLLLPDCPNAPEAVDKCVNRLFPVIREETFEFLLDVSGSMSGVVPWQGSSATRISVLKSQFEETVQNLQPNQKFNVVSFSSSYRRLWAENRPANQTNIREAASYVNNLSAGGGTSLLNALRPMMKNGLQAIYLLSDGMPDQQPATILNYVKDINNQLSSPIKIHCTAFASGASASNFMKSLADLTGGIFTDINDNNQ